MVTQLIGGAVADRGKKILTPSQVHDTPLNPGEDVILFLFHWEAEETAVIAFGPAGVYRVDEGRTTVPNSVRRWDVFKDQHTVRADSLMEALRTLKDAR